MTCPTCKKDHPVKFQLWCGIAKAAYDATIKVTGENSCKIVKK